jgi:hypothetical protein
MVYLPGAAAFFQKAFSQLFCAPFSKKPENPWQVAGVLSSPRVFKHGSATSKLIFSAFSDQNKLTRNKPSEPPS